MSSKKGMKGMKWCKSAGCILVVLLSACATVFSETSQDIQVSTSPEAAECVIERNGREAGRINSTPGSARVEKSKEILTVKCVKPGYRSGVELIQHTNNPWFLANIPFAFVLVGLIGMGIDTATGAAFKYVSPVYVGLERGVVTPPEPQPVPPASTPL